MKFQTQASIYFLAFSSAVSAICYFPNGFTTSQHVACDNNDQSPCCPPGYACLSNRLCVQTDAKNDTVGYARGSCTDKTWRSSLCPNFCVRGGAPWNDLLNRIQPMRKCDDNNAGLYYCADGNVDAVDCAKPSAVVTLGPATTMTVIGTTQTGQTSTTGAAQGRGSSRATAIGVGVGVPIGILLVGVVGFSLCRWRRQRTREPEMLPSCPVGNGYGGYRAHKGSVNEANGNTPLYQQPVEAPMSEVGEMPGDAVHLSPIELPATEPR